MSRLFLSPPHISGNEQKYITEAFATNYIAPLGPFVDRFEQSICDYTEAKYALATTSGTAAIHLALRVLGVGPGDIVLASTFTFVGSVAPILYQGATPYFIDSEAESWNLDPVLLREAIAKSPKKPKALILTHLYGQVADIEQIVSICRDSGVALIEDAAESLGAFYFGRQSGTFGDFGIYSFNGNKILTTSGGGMLVSRDQAQIEKAGFYATQAKEEEVYYEHKELGYNYRMSNILAAIGVAQMELLDARITACRQIFSWYEEELNTIDEITFMPEIEGSRGNRWLTTLLFVTSDREKVRIALEAEDIESRPLWKPMHLQPLFDGALSLTNGTSERLFSQGLCLPSGTAMTKDDVQRVCTAIRKVIS